MFGGDSLLLTGEEMDEISSMMDSIDLAVDLKVRKVKGTWSCWSCSWFMCLGSCTYRYLDQYISFITCLPSSTTSDTILVRLRTSMWLSHSTQSRS